MGLTHTKGKNFAVAVNGTTVGLSKTCTLEVKMDFLEIVDPTNGGWKQYVPQTGEWSISCQGFVSEFTETLYLAYSERTLLTVQMTDAGHGLKYYGSAYIDSLQQAGSLREIATYTLKLKGTGKLTCE